MRITLKAAKDPKSDPYCDHDLAERLGRAFVGGVTILVVLGLAILTAVAVIGCRVLT